MNSQSLEGQVAVVTGAGSGIGRAVALALADAGAKVHAVGRTASSLDDLATEAHVRGRPLVTTAVDVSKPAEVREFAEREIAAHGRIDLLVNSAGLMYLGPIRDGELEDWNAMLETNVAGVLNTMNAVLPAMLAQRSGDILNISSITARLIGPGTGVYSATKKAVEVITESTRQELAGTGVRVACLQLGGVATGLNDKIRNKSMRRLIKMRSQSYHDLPADLVADEILHMLSRPRCMSIASSFLLPTDQAR